LCSISYGRNCEGRRKGGETPQNGYLMCTQIKHAGRYTCANQGDQSSRNSVAYLLEHKNDNQHTSADSQAIWISAGSNPQRFRKTKQQGALGRRNAKDRRELPYNNVDRDTCEESRCYRHRQKVCNPSRLQRAGRDQRQSDQQGQGRGEVAVLRRSTS